MNSLWWLYFCVRFICQDAKWTQVPMDLHLQIPWNQHSTFSTHFRSNCDSRAANILRQHYKRPYFLPVVSESSSTDWIFMGSPGYGAHMHVSKFSLLFILLLKFFRWPGIRTYVSFWCLTSFNVRLNTVNSGIRLLATLLTLSVNWP